MGRFIIFGGNGFVGKHLTAELIKQGKEVIVCDMEEPVEAAVGYKYMHVDITKLEELAEVPLQADDIVVHLAARQYHLAVPRQGRKEFFFDVNYQGTENILKEMERHGCCKLIYFSTDMTYGKPQFLPVTVTHPQNPFGPYGGSKKASEDLCREFRKKGFDITIFRPRMILGPGRLGILKKLFKLMEHSLPVPMIGSGKNCYQMISVFDCVTAILQAVKKGVPNGEYNLGSNNPPTVHDLLATVIKEVGSHSVLIPTNGPLVKKTLALMGHLGLEIMYKEQYEIADENYLVDIEHTMEDLDWKPQYNDMDMLYQAYEYYQKEKGGRR